MSFRQHRARNGQPDCRIVRWHVTAAKKGRMIDADHTGAKLDKSAKKGKESAEGDPQEMEERLSLLFLVG